MASKSEYLQRYVSGLTTKTSGFDTKFKKRRKKRPIAAIASRLSIIDDDVNLSDIKPRTVEEPVQESEPTVAEYVDERPEHVKILEQFVSEKWKALSAQPQDYESDQSKESGECSDSDAPPPSPPTAKPTVTGLQTITSSLDKLLFPSNPENKLTVSEFRTVLNDAQNILQRQQQQQEQQNKEATEHNLVKERSPPVTRHDSDSDQSPARRKSSSPSVSPVRHDSDSDSDLSPRRAGVGSRSSSFSSPASSPAPSPKRPVKTSRVLSGKKTKRKPKDITPSSSSESSSDQSPDRRYQGKSDSSDSDMSPLRREFESSDSYSRSASSDISPVRNKSSRNKQVKSKLPKQAGQLRSEKLAVKEPHRSRKSQFVDERNQSLRQPKIPQRLVSCSSESDSSPARKKTSIVESSRRVLTKDDKTSVKGEKKSLDYKGRVTKTLSGAKAGLSSAREMTKEIEKLKRKEQKAYDKIDKEILGKDAKTVFRDKSGKKRDLKQEAELKAKDDALKAEKTKKYAEWGKGLKQKEAESRKVADAVHEMSKPMSRHRDDSDLDEMLRQQDREEDPMLRYLSKKKKKAKGEKEMPKYKGPPAPQNRFNIQPGYRWDGVDRSNGFEKKYYATLAAKKAIREEAYKWATEDM